MKQDNDFDAQKKTNPLQGLLPDTLAEFIKKEAVYVALVTGISYYLTYSFQSSYLSYFGVAKIFVDLALSKVIVSAIGVIFLSFSIYQIASLLPLPALKRFVEASYVFPHISFPLFILMFSMWISGYSYFSQAIAAYLLIVGPWTGIRLRRKLRSGTLWREILRESVDNDEKIRPHLLGTAIADSSFGGVFLLAIILITGTSLLGDWAGNRAAFRERDFMLVEFQKMEVALIGTYNEQLIGVAVERVDEDASLTGSIFLIPPASGDGHLSMQTQRMHIKKIEHPERNSIEWITFEDAWRRNSASILGLLGVYD
ncbi:hypothetical protein RPE78_12395 [Thioclava litoralis]|uniref:RDD family protein n=1 Tax=Thioclava litoralis TaxID=3076557 RepID=A0ABZ1DXG7_9RHOB|nr:hypothetical protein RPE78_12395 [Thioclava sp. FTW29]